MFQKLKKNSAKQQKTSLLKEKQESDVFYSIFNKLGKMQITRYL